MFIEQLLLLQNTVQEKKPNPKSDVFCTTAATARNIRTTKEPVRNTARTPMALLAELRWLLFSFHL